MKIKKQFNFNECKTRKIALKVSYFGKNYYGFQYSKEKPTIEQKIFEALQKTCLIPSVEDCSFSRAGRTDRGVSGYGQVISLYVRSINPNSGLGFHSKQENMQIEPELDYLNIINRILPPEIRILSWSPVSTSFDARFSCTSRKYHYYFPVEQLDIKSMQNAASLFIGEIDARNICKIDPQKSSIPNYFNRKITKSEIIVDGKMACFVVQGRAFLWHQVRCMMALLFLVGKGKEQPSIIPDILKLESRPNYQMASDTGLVLMECGYDDSKLNWQGSNSSLQKTWQEINQRLIDAEHQVALIKSLQDQLLVNWSSLQNSGSIHQFPVKTEPYTPLLKRSRCDSVETVTNKRNKK